ncbi:NAD binding domain of 6-phosphogluconate dehydrogenase-domain-containing protein [Fusarium redolens]|uniref:3-hydroxyisobutyrate dehydrogenase n=1 Tax=Fusarium redolens TaxID=48865 RepID=A0A9P9KKQ9_FUSRE|nr:NAD binding domain of 6-phosphogluconate dehydrogenase-domain-containing protein [Fusarium redolens]KAH7260745.1 NAD binding domain of 6-phosphogluconate dehydrogenase-domain-containing protein [Fusarium redolens]
MLPRGEHVLQVFTESQTGLLSLSPEDGEGKVFIDCSTIDVKTSQGIGKVVQQSGLGVFADVPLSGGQGGANAGTLNFMVGGEDDVFERINPMLALVGKTDNIFHCDSVKLAGVINSREQNPVKGVSPTASSATGFTGGFSTELCNGVLEMSMELARQLGAKCMLEPVVRKLYGTAAKNEKCSGQVFRSIYCQFSEEEGKDLPRT